MRITQRDIENVCKRLNVMQGFDEVPEYSTIGSFVLSGAYGGYSLHQYTNESGGVNDVLRCGHIPKGELYGRMQALISGLYLAKEGTT